VKRLLLGVAFSAMFCVSVQADEPTTEAIGTNAGAGHDWSGFFAGVQAGGHISRDKWNDPNFPAAAGVSNFNGALVGVHAGYYAQHMNYVFGLVGELEWTQGSKMALSPGPVFRGGGLWGGAKARWQAAILARIGRAFDNYLLYGTAGLALGNYRFDFGGAGLPAAFQDGFTKTVAGVTFGVGGSAVVHENMIASLEVRHTIYGAATGTIINCCAPPPSMQRHVVTTTAVRASMTFMLGGILGQ